MRRESFQQFAIVAADSAQQLTEQLNAKLFELRNRRPQVTFDGLIARISYSEDVNILEELSDEYEEVGIKLTCQACPMFHLVRKMTEQSTKGRSGAAANIRRSGTVRRPNNQKRVTGYTK